MPTPETARGTNRALTPQAAQGFQSRQQAIHDRLAEVEQTTPDSPDHLPRVERVLAAVDELLDYENRIPSLPEEQERRRNGLVVGTLTVSWTVVMVVVSVIVLFADGRSNWWLLLTVAVVGGSFVAGCTELEAPAIYHRRRAVGAVVWSAGALTGAALSLADLPVGLLAITGLLLAAGAALMLHRIRDQVGVEGSGH